jgi:transcriptional regulator with XRE-family HTH domain
MAAPKEPGAEEFGRRIKARREELGLSRRDLVEASGLSYPYVSQLETGYRLPSHKALAALAAALELSPSELSASIPYEEALASSDLGAHRKPRSAGAPRSRAQRSRAAGWYGNPEYVGSSVAASLPPPDPRRVAQQIAELVGSLPREQRLDALHLAQRQVLDQVVTEELEDQREP